MKVGRLRLNDIQARRKLRKGIMSHAVRLGGYRRMPHARGSYISLWNHCAGWAGHGATATARSDRRTCRLGMSKAWRHGKKSQDSKEANTAAEREAKIAHKIPSAQMSK